MFKATHKRRATTLSKTLLTAGLLGGAALSTLGAGSAQAAWTPNPGPGGPPPIIPRSDSYSCDFGGIVACEVGDPSGIVGAPPNTSDKVLTLLDWTSIPTTSVLNFSYNSLDPTPFEVDLEFDGLSPGAKDFDGGSLSYLLEIVGSPLVFDIAELRWNTGFPSPTVTKEIFSDSSFTTKICELNANPSQCNISGQKIWVRDTWGATAGGMDNISNDYSQVPAPLPLLGVGAAFGSIRKLRKFSSQLKTFSMG
jgi:hypothetical protein